MNHLPAVAAATLKGLADAILHLDFSDPMAFEQAVSIGSEIERTAGRVVMAIDEDRFAAIWMTQEAAIHEAVLDTLDKRLENAWNAMTPEQQAECEAAVDAELRAMRIQVATPEEDAALDLIERAHPAVFGPEGIAS